MECKNTWGGARKGAGAPITVSKNDRRINRAVSFSNSEWSEIGKQASARNISKSEYIRRKTFYNEPSKVHYIAVNEVAYPIDNEKFSELSDCFDVHQILDNEIFCKAWIEYEGIKPTYENIIHIENYSNDFVRWVIFEQKSIYYNLIGLVDQNGNIFDEFK